ncbi:MAG TPA: hypothetical protein ENF41_04070 [Candidatus Bathyarchaeota archaeon]|nr:hypothetical protein [Candidatus Bathyarchaeota archaeon]
MGERGFYFSMGFSLLFWGVVTLFGAISTFYLKQIPHSEIAINNLWMILNLIAIFVTSFVSGVVGLPETLRRIKNKLMKREKREEKKENRIKGIAVMLSGFILWTTVMTIPTLLPERLYPPLYLLALGVGHTMTYLIAYVTGNRHTVIQLGTGIVLIFLSFPFYYAINYLEENILWLLSLLSGVIIYFISGLKLMEKAFRI